jgi:hypothetical protein
VRHRAPGKRDIQAFELIVELKRWFQWWKRENGYDTSDEGELPERAKQLAPFIPMPVRLLFEEYEPPKATIPVPFELFVRIVEYINEDCPKAEKMLRLPGLQEFRKNLFDAIEEVCTPEEWARFRGIKLSSVDRRIKRSARRSLKETLTDK